MCCGKLKLVPFAEAASYTYALPVKELSSTSSTCEFMTFYCASPEKVNVAFKVVGIKIDSMDAMKRLAGYYDRGEAKAYYKVDLKELLHKIILTPEEQDNPSCKMVCTY